MLQYRLNCIQYDGQDSVWLRPARPRRFFTKTVLSRNDRPSAASTTNCSPDNLHTDGACRFRLPTRWAQPYKTHELAPPLSQGKSSEIDYYNTSKPIITQNAHIEKNYLSIWEANSRPVMKIRVDDELRAGLGILDYHSEPPTLLPYSPEKALDQLKTSAEKPLGYLPVSTIKTMCHTTPEALIGELKENGRMLEIFQASKIHPECLVSWNNDALAALSIREAPRDFAMGMHENLEPPRTEKYDAIADAFADHLNPDRLYVKKGNY
jgi:hypothetical protein